MPALSSMAILYESILSFFVFDPWMAFPPKADLRHVERMAEHKWDLASLAEIGDPIPGKNAFHRDGDVWQEWFDGALQKIGVNGHVFMKQGFSVLVEDADVHCFCVQIDAAIIRMLLCVKSHLVLRELMGF